jgi:CheY-like chemotaxis protein
MHGGRLVVASEGEGKGSEFTLCLPIGAEAEAAPAPARRPPASSDKVAAKRVLIVDDNFDAASTLEGLMRSLGHVTRVAYHGQQALEIAQDFKPQVVLLDIGLPDISGYEVARRLRTIVSAPMKIVAVTGWGTETDRNRSAEAGFDLHLVKPVDESELMRLLGNGGSASLH